MNAVETLKTMHMPSNYSRNGWVYVLSNKLFNENIYKIGMTTRTPEERVKELSVTSLPCEFDIVLAYASNNPREDEIYIHKYLSEHRINNNREFFRCEISKIKDAAHECGLIERNEFIENIAVDNEIIGLGNDEDYQDMILYQSGITWCGNIESIKNYIFEVGLKQIINEIKNRNDSLVTTEYGAFFIRNTPSQTKDKENVMETLK